MSTDKLREKWLEDYRSCPSRDDIQNSLGLSHIGGLFYVLMATCCICFLVLLLELMVEKGVERVAHNRGPPQFLKHHSLVSANFFRCFPPQQVGGKQPKCELLGSSSLIASVLPIKHKCILRLFWIGCIILNNIRVLILSQLIVKKFVVQFLGRNPKPSELRHYFKKFYGCDLYLLGDLQVLKHRKLVCSHSYK